jgi:hypothetical protein
MPVVSDSRFLDDMGRLEQAVTAMHLDLEELGAALARVEEMLHDHAEDVGRPDKLIPRQERSARPSLGREAIRLRMVLGGLLIQARRLHAQAVAGEGELREKTLSLLTALRRLRDDEADLTLESVTTELGAGD